MHRAVLALLLTLALLAFGVWMVRGGRLPGRVPRILWVALALYLTLAVTFTLAWQALRGD